MAEIGEVVEHFRRGRRLGQAARKASSSRAARNCPARARAHGKASFSWAGSRQRTTSMADASNRSSHSLNSQSVVRRGGVHRLYIPRELREGGRL